MGFFYFDLLGSSSQRSWYIIKNWVTKKILCVLTKTVCSFNKEANFYNQHLSFSERKLGMKGEDGGLFKFSKKKNFCSADEQMAKYLKTQ